MRFAVLPALLVMLVSCSAYKLHVRLDGRPAESMVARIDKVNGVKTVDLVLPGGLWAVHATESGINPHILEIDGLKHVRFQLPPDRMLSLRPIELTLQGLDLKGQPSGNPIIVTIDQYNRTQKASPYS